MACLVRFALHGVVVHELGDPTVRDTLRVNTKSVDPGSDIKWVKSPFENKAWSSSR